MKEEDSAGKSGSFESTKIYDTDAKGRRQLNGCLYFMEISIDPGVKSLKHLDSQKLKGEIKKWAKAVVTYARKVSQKLASPRNSEYKE